MTSKRYLGNIITDTPTEPTENYESSAASGVWSLAEVERYTKAGVWPTAGNSLKVYFFPSSSSNVISSIVTTSLGNAVDFGDTTQSYARTTAFSSSTRGLMAAGYDAASNNSNVIEYITLATAGNSTDFGDTTVARNYPTSCASSTRGVMAGGNTSGAGFTPSNIMDYVTIASTGNATDFGDCTVTRIGAAGCASTTRGVFSGGLQNGLTFLNTIDYITIASTGNATDFGDLTASRYSHAGCSNSTRGVFAGGFNSTDGYFDVIDYITIASTGNAIDFGDLTGAGEFENGGAASNNRALFAGGTFGNAIQYITITSLGNAADFGDLLSTYRVSACSNAHGGLS